MPTRPFLARIRAVLKHKTYPHQDVGGCHVVSRWLEIHYGFRQTFGCYVNAFGHHTEHCWNILPDGRILDATADQFPRFLFDDAFGGKHGVYIGSSRSNRYVERCDCNYDWSYQLRRNSRRMRTVNKTARVLLGAT